MDQEFPNSQETTSKPQFLLEVGKTKNGSKCSQPKDYSSLHNGSSVNQIVNPSLFTDETNNDLDNYLNTSLPECSQFLKEYEENYFECRTMDHLNKNIKRRYQKKAGTAKNKFFKSNSSGSISVNNEIPVINEAINKIFKPLTEQPIVAPTQKQTLRSYSRHKKHIVESFGLPDEPILPSVSTNSIECGLIDLHAETVNTDVGLFNNSWMNTESESLEFHDGNFRESRSFIDDHLQSTDYGNFRSSISEDFTIEENVEEKGSEERARLPKVLLKILDLDNIDIYKSNNLSPIKNKSELLYERLKSYSNSINNMSTVSEESINSSTIHKISKKIDVVEMKEKLLISPRKSSRLLLLKSPTRVGSVNDQTKNEIEKEEKYEKKHSNGIVSMNQKIKNELEKEIQKIDVSDFPESPEKTEVNSSRRLTRQSYNNKDEKLNCSFSNHKMVVRSKTFPLIKVLRNSSQNEVPKQKSDKKILLKGDKRRNGDNFNKELVQTETRRSPESNVRRKSSRMSKSVEKLGVVYDSPIKINKSDVMNEKPVIKSSKKKIKVNYNSTDQISESQCQQHMSFKKSPTKLKDEKEKKEELISPRNKIDTQKSVFENNNVRNINRSTENIDGSKNFVPKNNVLDKKDQETSSPIKSLQEHNKSSKKSSKSDVKSNSPMKTPNSDKRTRISAKKLEFSGTSPKQSSSQPQIPILNGVSIVKKEIREIEKNTNFTFKTKIPKRKTESKKSPVKMEKSKEKSDSGGLKKFEEGPSKLKKLENKLKLNLGSNIKNIKLQGSRELRSNRRNNMEENMTVKNEKEQEQKKRREGKINKQKLKESSTNKNNEEKTSSKTEDKNRYLNKSDSVNSKDLKMVSEIDFMKENKTVKVEFFMEENKCKNISDVNENKSPPITKAHNGKMKALEKLKEIEKLSPNQSCLLKNPDKEETEITRNAPTRKSLRLKTNSNILVMKSPETIKLKQKNDEIEINNEKQQNDKMEIKNENSSTESKRLVEKKENIQISDEMKILEKKPKEKDRFRKKYNNKNRKNGEGESKSKESDTDQIEKEKSMLETNEKSVSENEVMQFKEEILNTISATSTNENSNTILPKNSNENFGAAVSENLNKVSDITNEENSEKTEKSPKNRKKHMKEDPATPTTKTHFSDEYLDVGYDTHRRTSFRKILEKVMDISRSEMEENQQNDLRTQRCKSVPHEMSNEIPMYSKSASADSKLNFFRNNKDKKFDASKAKKRLDYSEGYDLSDSVKRVRTKSLHITKFQMEAFKQQKDNIFEFQQSTFNGKSCVGRSQEEQNDGVSPRKTLSDNFKEVIGKQNGEVSPIEILENGAKNSATQENTSVVSPVAVLQNNVKNCLAQQHGVSAKRVLQNNVANGVTEQIGSVSTIALPETYSENYTTEANISVPPIVNLKNNVKNCIAQQNGVSTKVFLQKNCANSLTEKIDGVSPIADFKKNADNCLVQRDASASPIKLKIENYFTDQNTAVLPPVALRNCSENAQVERDDCDSPHFVLELVNEDSRNEPIDSTELVRELSDKTIKIEESKVEEDLSNDNIGKGMLITSNSMRENIVDDLITSNKIIDDDQLSQDEFEGTSEIDFVLSNEAFATDCESDFTGRDVSSRASSVETMEGTDGRTSRKSRSSMRKPRRNSRRFGRSSSRKRINMGEIERELAQGDRVLSKAAGKVYYEYKIGDSIWGKVGTYPFWPCLIVMDPETSEFKKYKLLRTTPYYHVRFFGDKGRRAWTTHVLPYEGPDDLEKMEQKLWRKGVQTSYIKESYCVKPTQINKWKQAVSEAEMTKNEPFERKLEFFDRLFEEEKRQVVSKQSQAIMSGDTTLPPEKNVVKANGASEKRKNIGDATSCSSEDDDDRDNDRSSQESPTATEDTSTKKRKRKRPKNRCEENMELALDLLEISTGLPEPGSRSRASTRVYPATRSRSSSRPKKNADLCVGETKPSHALAVGSAPPKSLREKKPQQQQTSTLDQSDTESKASDISFANNNTNNVSHLSEYKKNVFRGAPKEKVCQLCEKNAEVIKCRGVCNGDYHAKCVDNSLKKTRELLADETKKESKKEEREEEEEEEDNDQVQIITVNSRKKLLTDGIVLLPSNKDDLPLGERIDEKMKEIMKQVETGFAELTDSSGSEETNSIDNLKQESPTIAVAKTLTPFPVALQQSSSNNRSHQKTKNVFKHVTADDVSIIRIDDEGKTEEICIPTEAPSVVDETNYKCSYCTSSVIPPCFVCNALMSRKGNTLRQRCSLQKCGRYYHLECLNLWPQTQWSFILHEEKKKSEALDSFVCPRHACHICASESLGCSMGRCPNDKLVKCLRCPATYHNSYHCVPAGTQILTSTQIICPRHSRNNTSNTVWCFVCSEGGNLICCETCPTSVHAECLPVNLLDDDTYVCEDCESGRFPLYGEVVWVKCGNFRWWPAIVLFPAEVPANVETKPHAKGDFVVKFFGTYDYYWVGRGRTFLYQEGDTGCLNSNRNKIDEAFGRALKEAAEVYRLKKESKSKREKEVNNGLKPPPYVRIKVNRPVGNVRVFEGNLSNTTSCDCDPNDDYPCGPNSNCLNRILMTECNPEVCPAGQRCQNQCFEKREYPQVAPYRTPSRGWGLKSSEPIEKGRFIIEYVGEIIDDEEYQRRLKRMHQQKDENYYFLTIDNNRMLDAGPKGNAARFMNHSCNPNCETQKWTVNGDTRVGLFAIEDIPCDTELTFNYNLECAGDGKKICRCGAPNCSGFIGAKTEDPKPSKRQRTDRKRDPEIRNVVVDNKGPCFVCGKDGGDDVGKCANKSCHKSYHLECVQLEAWPDGKWNCPCHSCNICSSRTMRSCIKCTNSYCPKHSAGNVRHDGVLGFVCSQHDPTKTERNRGGRPRKKRTATGSSKKSKPLKNQRKRQRDFSEVKLPSPKKMKFDQV